MCDGEGIHWFHDFTLYFFSESLSQWQSIVQAITDLNETILFVCIIYYSYDKTGYYPLIHLEDAFCM